jgi:hypothetical protein
MLAVDPTSDTERASTVCSYKVRVDLSEHERSVEKHDAKRSASQHFSSVQTNTQGTQNSRQGFYFFYKIQIIEKFCA